MTSTRGYRSTVFTALLIAFLAFSMPQRSYGSASDESALKHLFSLEQDVVSLSVDGVIQEASKLSATDRFDFLTDWVLASESRPSFRMNSRFVQIDPIANSELAPEASVVDGIASPVFFLLSVAKQTGRLPELRQRVQAITYPMDPQQSRAKLALRFMIDIADSASKPLARREASSSPILTALATSVRTREPDVDELDWPEILALAYGMQAKLRSDEFLEFVTSIYSFQIENLSWDKNAAWDVYAFGVFAKLQLSDQSDSPSLESSDNSFESWHPAAVVSANSRGNGFTEAMWRPAGESVHKLAGHNNDYLYFPSPLTGDFEIECEVTGFNFKESQVAYGGVFASHHSSRSQAEIGGIRSQTMLPLDPPMSPPDNWLSCRVSVRDGVCRHFINGRLLLQQDLADGHFPWLAVRTHRLSHGAIRNLTISGSPEVPSTIAMVNSPELVGWYSYYDEAIDEQDDSLSWRSVSIQDSNAAFELQHAAQRELAGSNLESLLMYHRPMMEDGSVEYEFFYSAGDTTVHPAIDRLAFLLEADGLRTHWVTDGAHQPGNLSPANRVVEEKHLLGHEQIALRDQSWNRVRFVLQGDTVRLLLNGTPVMEHPLEPSNRRQFGLFHFADKTNVRVRNLRWSGNWPKAEAAFDGSHRVRPDTAEIERLASELPQSYQQDLRNLKLDPDYFIQRGGHITIDSSGIGMEAKGSQRTDLPLWLEVGGDFDLRATFEDFRHANIGDGGLEMLAYLPSDGQKIRVARHRWDNKEQKLRTRFSPMTDSGHQTQRARDHWSANEATSGVFRMVRLGTTVYYLFAENDSSTFRLLSTDEVGLGPLNAGGITLTAFAEKDGSASTKWTNVSVRAEQISGVAVQNMQQLRSELDVAKNQLKESFTHDFTTTSPDPNTLAPLNNDFSWKAADNGLRMRNIRTANWSPSALLARLNVAGDFDARLEFDELELVNAGAGQQAKLSMELQPTAEPRTLVNSMLGLNSPGIIQAEGYVRVRMPDGSHWYNGTERHTVTSATALRIVRRGKRFFMLVRADDEAHDRIVSMSDHSDAPVNGIVMTLNSGGVGSESSVRLKKLEIHSEQ
ncbi:DUF1583 domain-containing protein [Rhodopirellula bahusiensis]|uniref:DUF1583 domain-containing protein n=1 Tax=Rhodopirellula bahusiensis TaxID=2014065 RepID=UPI003262DFB7